jgi:Zn-dependent metalloprotease
MKTLLTFIFLTNIVHAFDCKNEARKFCPEIQPGKGELFQCLEENKKDLSGKCIKELEAFKTKMKKDEPCFFDFKDHCHGINSFGANLGICLLHNESKLSTNCANDFKKKKVKILKDVVCAEDISKLCYSTLKEEAGLELRCLIKNEKKLSPLCQKQIIATKEKIKKNNPCFEDTEKHCPGIVNRFEIDKCLQKQKSLAPACFKVQVNEIKKAKEMHCYNDQKRLCKPNINPVELNRCLEINQKNLSSQCQGFLANSQKKALEREAKCEADRLKFCPNAKPMNGEILKCLMGVKAKLSKECAGTF